MLCRVAHRAQAVQQRINSEAQIKVLCEAHERPTGS